MRLELIKRYLPTRREVQSNKYLQFLGDHLHDPNLWRFNRRSITRATAIGLFCAYLPMPFEMIPAAIAAVLWRANLPVSIALVWISNPVTWVPLWGPAYLFGAWLLGQPSVPFDQLTLEIFGQHIVALWMGCIVVGSVVAAGGFFMVNLIWRSRVINSWQRRRELRKVRQLRDKSNP